MVTINTKKEDKDGDVSLALGRCADKISLINELFVNAEEVDFSYASPQGLFWILQDIENDLRFLDDHYILEKKEEAEQKEEGKEVLNGKAK